MDKKTILPIFFLMIISLSVLASAELTNYSNDCTDSDSGLNYFIKGNVIYNNYDYPDSCVTSDAVVNEGQPNEYHLEVGDIQEYACYYPQDTKRCYETSCPFIKYHCPYGCKDGACLSASSNIPSCMSNHPIYGQAWYDNNGILTNSSCLSCSPICDKVGTPEEGWYSSCDNSLIKLDTCGVRKGNLDCNDNDGKDYFIRGTNSFQGSNTIEICSDENGKPTTGEEGTSVIETWCQNGIKKEEVHVCENGCSAGACVKCSDSDGRDYYTRGTNEFDGSSTIEICVGDDGKPTTGEEGTQVTESWCENNERKTEIYPCSNDCSAGACIKIIPDKNPIEIPNMTKEACQGCVLEDKCYPFGYRKAGNFCSDTNNQFIEQKQGDSNCENNFECSSNVCVSGKCLSESFLQKILNWFKRLFG